jgi:hypothetical protein
MHCGDSATAIGAPDQALCVIRLCHCCIWRHDHLVRVPPHTTLFYPPCNPSTYVETPHSVHRPPAFRQPERHRRLVVPNPHSCRGLYRDQSERQSASAGDHFPEVPGAGRLVWFLWSAVFLLEFGQVVGEASIDFMPSPCFAFSAQLSSSPLPLLYFRFSIIFLISLSRRSRRQNSTASSC